MQRAAPGLHLSGTYGTDAMRSWASTMAGTAACVFRVNLELTKETDRPVVAGRGASRSLTVVAADAEAAINRARACVSDELHKGEHARIACVEFVSTIDVL